jgi:hypothetical protein
MKFFKFGKKKEEKERPSEEIKKPTELEKICANDKEVYEALKDTMFLDPRKIRISMREAEERAKEFEKSGDKLRAIIYYRMAGGLAIYEGNAQKVKEFFGKCQELSGKSYSILKIPEKAIAKAKEYYEKYLKEEKEEKK